MLSKLAGEVIQILGDIFGEISSEFDR